MKFVRNLLAGLLAMAAAPLAGAGEIVRRASLQQVTNFGANASGTKMYIYVPAKLATKPGIIVAIHYCSGTAQAYYSGTPYAKLAETHGFIVIYPSSPYSGTCWDVSSKAALTHGGGGDSNSIANMVTWTISKYSADASKVFVTGSSSGAMMTNVMSATYPELFAAASVYSGVPAGCFVSAGGSAAAWNSTCAQGKSIASQAAWAATAKAMYPSYTGSRPKMMIYHGSADTTLYPRNFNETMKQWSGVFGYTYGSPSQTVAHSPSSAYTKYVYGPNLVGVYGAGIGHSVPVMGDQDMAWFGFTGTPAKSTPENTTPSGGGSSGGETWCGCSAE